MNEKPCLLKPCKLLYRIFYLILLALFSLHWLELIFYIVALANKFLSIE